MKKDYILIIAGIIPLLFSVFVMNFFLKDDRSEMFESAKLLEEKNICLLRLLSPASCMALIWKS